MHRQGHRLLFSPTLHCLHPNLLLIVIEGLLALEPGQPSRDRFLHRYASSKRYAANMRGLDGYILRIEERSSLAEIVTA